MADVNVVISERLLGEGYDLTLSLTVAIQVIAWVSLIVVIAVVYLMFKTKFWRKGYERLVFISMIVNLFGRICIIGNWLASNLQGDALLYGGLAIVFLTHVSLSWSMACNAGIFYVLVRTRAQMYGLDDSYRLVYFGVASLCVAFLVSLIGIFVVVDVMFVVPLKGIGVSFLDPHARVVGSYLFAIIYAIPFIACLAFCISLCGTGSTFILPAGFKKMQNMYAILSLFWALTSLPFALVQIIRALSPERLHRSAIIITFMIASTLPITDCIIVLRTVLWGKYKALGQQEARTTVVTSAYDNDSIAIIPEVSMEVE